MRDVGCASTVLAAVARLEGEGRPGGEGAPELLQVPPLLEVRVERRGVDADQLLAGVDSALRTVLTPAPPAGRRNPGADLPGDVTRSNRPPLWKVDQKTGALVDQNSGRSWNFGDTVTVCMMTPPSI